MGDGWIQGDSTVCMALE